MTNAMQNRHNIPINSPSTSPITCPVLVEELSLISLDSVDDSPSLPVGPNWSLAVDASSPLSPPPPPPAPPVDSGPAVVDCWSPPPLGSGKSEEDSGCDPPDSCCKEEESNVSVIDDTKKDDAVDD
jgi:hypothetical protein